MQSAPICQLPVPTNLTFYMLPKRPDLGWQPVWHIASELLGCSFYMLQSAFLVWHGSSLCWVGVEGLQTQPIQWSCQWHQCCLDATGLNLPSLSTQTIANSLGKSEWEWVLLLDPPFKGMDWYQQEGTHTNAASNGCMLHVLLPQCHFWCQYW